MFTKSRRGYGLTKLTSAKTRGRGKGSRKKKTMMKHTIFARLSHDYRTMKIAPIHCIARVPSYRTLTPSPDFRTILARFSHAKY